MTPRPCCGWPRRRGTHCRGTNARWACCWEGLWGASVPDAIVDCGPGWFLASFRPDGRRVSIVDHEDRIRIPDAVTESPVTRRLTAGGTVRWPGFGAGFTRVTALDPGRIQAWSVTPYTGELSPQRDWAMLLTGRKIDARGTVALLSPSEWTAFARIVRSP